jgi:hypothetical protein
MKNQEETFLILVLLIIQSILIFFVALIYIVFDKNFFNLDKFIGTNSEATIGNIVTLFAGIRVFLVSTILYKRGYQSDILTFVLMYLIFTSFLRFYYQYLIETESEAKIMDYIDKFEDINTVLFFLSSAYILKFILFN